MIHLWPRFVYFIKLCANRQVRKLSLPPTDSISLVLELFVSEFVRSIYKSSRMRCRRKVQADSGSRDGRETRAKSDEMTGSQCSKTRPRTPLDLIRTDRAHWLIKSRIFPPGWWDLFGRWFCQNSRSTPAFVSARGRGYFSSNTN